MAAGGVRHGFIGEWANQTTAHPVGLVVLGICVFAVLFLSRKRAVFPFIILLVAIPSAQRIVLAGVDFSFIRILIMVLIARALLKKEITGLNRENPDVWASFWIVWGIIAYTILFSSISATLNRVGFMFDTVGAYFVGRIYIRSRQDVLDVIKLLGWISIPTLFLFLNERLTGRNLFAEFGGVPDYTLVRDGRLRCQGPFSHPIMAGVFWASIMPWIGVLWFSKQVPKFLLVIFSISIIGIVLNTASSTPVMALIFGVLGIAFYVFRGKIHFFLWGGFFAAVILHLVMEKPVWHLISRINVVGGSTGWHRYHLIDKAVQFFEDWWLIGIRSTSHWGSGLGDVTNQYVLEGVRGGALGMVLFIVLIISTYRLIKKALKLANKKYDYWIVWGAGVVLFSHLMNFLAVSYFGQTLTAFYLFMGMTVSLAASVITLGKREMLNERRRAHAKKTEASHV